MRGLRRLFISCERLSVSFGQFPFLEYCLTLGRKGLTQEKTDDKSQTAVLLRSSYVLRCPEVVWRWSIEGMIVFGYNDLGSLVYDPDNLSASAGSSSRHLKRLGLVCTSSLVSSCYRSPTSKRLRPNEAKRPSLVNSSLFPARHCDRGRARHHLACDNSWWFVM